MSMSMPKLFLILFSFACFFAHVASVIACMIYRKPNVSLWRDTFQSPASIVHRPDLLTDRGQRARKAAGWFFLGWAISTLLLAFSL